MNKLIIALAATGLLGSGVAMAGPGGTTCATAEEIGPATTVSGDTSAAGYTNIINTFGGVPSPAADSVYTFTSDGQATSVVTVNADYNSGLALTSSCANNSSLLRANGGPGDTAYTVTIDNGAGAPLTAGTQYWLIMTGSPDGDENDVGTYNFTTPDPLPVSLQSFSID